MCLKSFIAWFSFQPEQRGKTVVFLDYETRVKVLKGYKDYQHPYRTIDDLLKTYENDNDFRRFINKNKDKFLTFSNHG